MMFFYLKNVLHFKSLRSNFFFCVIDMVDLWTVFRSQSSLATFYYITIMVSNYNLRIRIFSIHFYEIHFQYNIRYAFEELVYCDVFNSNTIYLIKIGKQIQKQFCIEKEKFKMVFSNV